MLEYELEQEREGKRMGRCYRPSWLVEELAMAVKKWRRVSVKSGSGVPRQRGCQATNSSGGVAVALPVAGSAPSIGTVCWGVLLAAANLVSCAPAPTSFYLALCDGAHQPCWVGHPDQGADQGPDLAIGSNLVEINLTFSLLISTYHLKFKLKLNIFISFLVPSHINA
jgi:hypothetical protein